MPIQRLRILIKSREVVSLISLRLYLLSNCYSFTETTLNDIRLQLAREEAAQVTVGELPQHSTSLSAFLMQGFELEDSQYVGVASN